MGALEFHPHSSSIAAWPALAIASSSIPDRAGFRSPLTVSSRQELIRCLRSAIPGFDEPCLTTESGVTQIVFAATLTMTDAQLGALFAD